VRDEETRRPDIRLVNAHVYRTDEAHATDGYDCWCDPVFLKPCDDCDQPEEPSGREVVIAMSRGRTVTVMDRPSCWKCQHGYIELARDEAETTDAALIVVHRA
jgi:hypothetical protein